MRNYKTFKTMEVYQLWVHRHADSAHVNRCQPGAKHGAYTRASQRHQTSLFKSATWHRVSMEWTLIEVIVWLCLVTKKYFSVTRMDAKYCGDKEGRKFSHKLPKDNIKLPFEGLQDWPTGIFRDTTGELLGPGAEKTGEYKNAEYYSYHHMSFFDLQLLLRKYRLPCPVAERKP